MALHFTREEFSGRQHRTIEQLKNRHLDGLLMFRQESMYYLSGYDSFGYVFFQCLYLDLDGNLVLLTRAPDLRQARHTSVIEDIRIWQDTAEADPAVQLKLILEEFGCRGQRLATPPRGSPCGHPGDGGGSQRTVSWRRPRGFRLHGPGFAGP